MRGIIGKKLGMTQIFDQEGRQVPVTAIQVGPCVVVQCKTTANDGYDAVQLGFEDRTVKNVTQPLRGHFKKAGTEPKRYLREMPLDEGETAKAGDVVTAAIFEGVLYVDVIGTTKGRGFQGNVKRHRMAGGPMAHGSMFHRRGGSIGQRTWPARVFKNKRMPGHMGHRRVTVQNVQVAQVRAEDHVILVRGAVMGPTGGLVLVRKSIKKAAKKS